MSKRKLNFFFPKYVLVCVMIIKKMCDVGEQNAKINPEQ